jgi:integrase
LVSTDAVLDGQAAVLQRVLAIPVKRFDRADVTYLTEPEVDALLAAPTVRPGPAVATTPCCCSPSKRGYARPSSPAWTAPTSTSAQARTSAATARGARAASHRSPPAPAASLRTWLQERRGQPSGPLFPTSRGRCLSRDALEHRLAKYVAIGSSAEPLLAHKRITLHVLRRTAAMRLLHAGVDTTVIALWLGHESVDTTQIYLRAHLALKECALARTAPPGYTPGGYQPPDTLLAFLEGL